MAGWAGGTVEMVGQEGGAVEVAGTEMVVSEAGAVLWVEAERKVGEVVAQKEEAAAATLVGQWAV